MVDFLKEARSMGPEIVSLREDFHRFPELGRKEYRTSEKIQGYLKNLGYEIHLVSETGIVAVLRNGDGKCVAYRSDMDALPIEEKNDVSFRSENQGIMHACGHDIHMASLLGAAKILSKHKNEMHGTIKLVFEMDEEGDGGAKEMLESGHLDDVDAMFGQHVSPDLPQGIVGVKYGRFYAAAATFDVRVFGKSAHGATPEKGIDALYSASLMCSALKELTGRYEGSKAVISIGHMEGGTARNIIADEALFEGIIRAPGLDLREHLKEKVLNVLREVSLKTGVTYEINLKDGYPGVVNHDGQTDFVKEEAVSFLKEKTVTVLKEETLTTEDFGEYLLKIPGSFYHLGVGGNAPLHGDTFLPDSTVAVEGAAFAAKILFDYLGEEK